MSHFSKQILMFGSLFLLSACTVDQISRSVNTVTAITPSPKQNVSAVTMMPNNNSLLANKMNEIMPLITDALSDAACGKNLQRYATADSYMNNYANVFMGMQYNKSACLTIVRTGAWNMKAKNAISFSAIFESPSSGESRSRDYLLIQQADGSWLFHF